MKHTYNATLPDGRIVTRTTDRIYTHVIAVINDSPFSTRQNWGAAAWAGRPDLAEKDVAKYSKWNFTRVVAIPVNNPRPELTPAQVSKENSKKLAKAQKRVVSLRGMLEVYRAGWDDLTIAKWEQLIKDEENWIKELETK